IKTRPRNPRRTRSSTNGPFHPRFRRRQKTLSLHFLAGKFSSHTDGLCPFTDFLLGGLFVVPAKLHFAKDAFTLQLSLQRSQCLVDVVISNKYLHEGVSFFNRAI